MVDKFNRETEAILFHLRHAYPKELKYDFLKKLTKMGGAFNFLVNHEFVRRSYSSLDGYVITGKGIDYLRELKKDRLIEEQTTYNRNLTLFTSILVFGTILTLLIESAKLGIEIGKIEHYILILGAFIIFTIILTVLFLLFLRSLSQK